MVVSGLPIRNGVRHASEIATMALHLLSAVMTFKIRHMPEVRLQLRIGIHSGTYMLWCMGISHPLQGPWWRVWWASRCRATVCSATRSTLHHVWSRADTVSACTLMCYASITTHAIIHILPALHVHVSDTTAQLLKQIGGFHLESRGERQIKVRM